MSEKSSWKNCSGGWSINLALETAKHESGFKLEFSGHPNSRNFGVQPSGAPQTATVLEWASLLREGTDEYRRAFGDDDNADNEDDSSGPGPDALRPQPRKPTITVKRKRQISQ